jgi:hypothetical protein
MTHKSRFHEILEDLTIAPQPIDYQFSKKILNPTSIDFLSLPIIYFPTRSRAEKRLVS